MGSWTNVAALLRAKANEGGLSVKPTEGLPFLLEKGMEVTFVPPVLRIPRSGKVLDIEEMSEGRYMVWFDCIDNRTDAEKLEGHFCLVRTSCLPENYMDNQDIDLTGFSVVDESAGVIGRVVRIDENPAHALLVVERTDGADLPDGGEAEVLIPLVDEFLVAVEEEMGEIRVSLPDGLLDL